MVIGELIVNELLVRTSLV